MSWKRNYFASGGGSGGVQGLMTPRNMTSIAPSKGLSNEPGQNSCFLNSALQVRYGDTHTKYLLLTHSESHLYDTLTLTPQSLSFTHTHTHTCTVHTFRHTNKHTYSHMFIYIRALRSLHAEKAHIYFPVGRANIRPSQHSSSVALSVCVCVREIVCVCKRERYIVCV